MAAPDLVRVVLRQVPVAVWARTQEHTDELLREFALIATSRQNADPGHSVPQRLMALVDQLTAEYGGFGEENEQALAEAAAAGVETIDLEYQMPPAVAEGARHLGDLLDEADDYCRRGEHLLTLATPAELVAFRNWFLDEFVAQIAGSEPVPWPDYDRAATP